jgi:hypothetical protein
MSTPLRLALTAAVLLAASTARAQSQPTEEAGGYRWQIAATDVAFIGATAGGLALEGRGVLDNLPSNMLMGIGIPGYFLGAPIVHVAHREYGRAGVSLALRLGLPILGGAIGARFASCTPGEWLCGLDEFGKGFATGAVVAAILDTAFVAPGARTTEEPESVAVARPHAARTTVAPRLVAAPNVAMLGLGGSF